MELDEMITDLFDMDIVGEDNSVVFSDEAKQQIHRIAEKCRMIPIVNETKEMAEDYSRDLSAEQIYTDMLHKIVEAPTRIHMRMSAMMLIPVIDRKLRGMESED